MSRLVLNTRPRDQAAELSRLLAGAGLQVLEAPAIEIVSAWDPAELRAVRDAVYDWIVLPSQNAGRELVADLGHAAVVCGAASARALGITPTITLERFSASAALEALRPLVRRGQRVLVPRAAESSPVLTDGLIALGVRLDAPIAYRTVAVEPSRLAEAGQRLLDGNVAAVTVCSPSAINSLLAAIGRDALATSRLICVGETTAAAARHAGLRVDGIAEKTSMASLVAAVLATLEREVAA